jgi:hypothetical protein
LSPEAVLGVGSLSPLGGGDASSLLATKAPARSALLGGGAASGQATVGTGLTSAGARSVFGFWYGGLSIPEVQMPALGGGAASGRVTIQGNAYLSPLAGGAASGRAEFGIGGGGYHSVIGFWYGGLQIRSIVSEATLASGCGVGTGLVRMGCKVRLELWGEDEASGLVSTGTQPTFTGLGGGTATGLAHLVGNGRINPLGGGDATGRADFSQPGFVTPRSSGAASSLLAVSTSQGMSVIGSGVASGLVDLGPLILRITSAGVASGVVSVRAPAARTVALGGGDSASILTFGDIKFITPLASVSSEGIVSTTQSIIQYLTPLGGGRSSGRVVLDGYAVDPVGGSTLVTLLRMTDTWGLVRATDARSLLPTLKWALRRI